MPSGVEMKIEVADLRKMFEVLGACAAGIVGMR
jgi:hypothetical protein